MNCTSCVVCIRPSSYYRINGETDLWFRRNRHNRGRCEWHHCLGFCPLFAFDFALIATVTKQLTRSNVSLGRCSHLHGVPLSVGLDKVIFFFLLVETLHISDSFHIVIF